MSQTTSPVPGPASGHLPGPAGPPAHQPVAAPRMLRQRRRRPGLIALSVALIATGGLAGAVLYTSSGQRSSVVVVARDVPIGAQITSADLSVASLALDPTVKSVKASAEKTLVGQRAAVDLKAGSLLAASQVTRKTLVGPGEQLVGVSLKPSQLPASPLSPGQKVVIVSTPDPNAAAGTGTGRASDDGAPKTLSATVVKVGDPQTGTGTVTVDVAVPAGDGPALASRVATGDIALIVASRQGN